MSAHAPCIFVSSQSIMFTAILTYWLLLLCVPESLPQKLLLATDSGVKIFTSDGSSLETILPHRVDAVDFRFSKHDAYFISNNTILYSYFSQYSNGHADPIPTVNVSHTLTDLVIDWESFMIYYSCKATSSIYEAPLLGSNPREIVSQVQRVQDLAIDPYARLLFFIKDNVLVSFGLKNHQSYEYFSATHGITKVVKVAVEHHNHEVFMVGYNEDDRHWHLVSFDYKNAVSNLVFNGPELTSPFALDVFNDEVVWGSFGDNKYTLYICKLSPACDIDNLNIVFQSSEVITDARFYNPLVQTPSTTYACSKLNCSHNCSVDSLYYVKCSCPEGMVLDPDWNICRNIPLPSEDTVSSMLYPWVHSAEEFFVKLVEAVGQWLSTMTWHVKAFVLICCVFMMVLLMCGFCLLSCVPKSKRSAKRMESYGLREQNLKFANSFKQKL